MQHVIILGSLLFFVIYSKMFLIGMLATCVITTYARSVWRKGKRKGQKKKKDAQAIWKVHLKHARMCLSMNQRTNRKVSATVLHPRFFYKGQRIYP